LGVPLLEKEEITQELAKAARGIKEGFLRVAVKREGTPRLIFHRHLRGTPYRKEFLRRGISVVTAATRQPFGEALPAQTKHSQRLSSILARMEGENAPEVLRLGTHGYLTEGTVSNLFVVKKRKLLTSPAWLGALEGVTRDEVMRQARRLRIPVLEIPFTRHDLFNADEAFLTNVLMGIAPIREADGRKIGAKVPGPVTRKLMRVLKRTMG
jgi:branched-chain amino acid aminotransferase